MPKRGSKKGGESGASLGFEEKLWQAADKMRGHMDPGEYKHVALGLIFLKYISDAFEDRRTYLGREISREGSPLFVRESGAREVVLEDRDEYAAENIFWVPKASRWSYLQARAKRPDIGKLIDDAMTAIEKENRVLKGVLPKEYARSSLDKQKLGELIDLISGIGLGDQESRSKDVLGRVYEYFLSKFAGAEGKKGGEFYTPRSVVRLLVEMIRPYKGRVYDPCCGSSGMFVQSEEFIRAHGGRIGDISIFGQESNPTTWRLAKMNLALRGIEANLGPHHADTFQVDLHRDLKADFILANPPFNLSDWGGDKLRDDIRWKFGAPPVGNANFAWVQHIVHHLAPNGVAGFVLANSCLSAVNTGEGPIRERIVRAGLLDCVVALPNQLFYGTTIPACLWFIRRSRAQEKDHRTLLIDARDLGVQVEQNRKTLTEEQVNLLTGTYHAWRDQKNYKDVPGFCKSVVLAEVELNTFNLSPNRYIEPPISEDIDGGLAALIPVFTGRNEKIYVLKNEAQHEFSEATKRLGMRAVENLHLEHTDTIALANLSSALFNEWFVDFNFICENKRPFRSSGGKLKFKDGSLLPPGWQMGLMPDVCDVVDCLHSAKPEQADSPTGNVVLQVFNIAEYGLLNLSEKFHVQAADYAHWIKNIEALPGICVITNTGRVGAVAQVPFFGKYAIGRNMTALRPKRGEIAPGYLIQFLLSGYMKRETYRLTDIGTILDSLNVKGINLVRVLRPESGVLEKFESFMRPLRAMMEINSLRPDDKI